MDKDLAQGNIGSIGTYEIDLASGEIVAKAEAAGGPVKAKVETRLDLLAVLDALKTAIPGSIDDAVIELIKGVLKS